MADTEKCRHCSFEIPISWVRCPHCARPGLYPNVRQAVHPDEQSALQARYSQARQHALHRGAAEVLECFEKEVKKRSQAVINRRLSEVDRLSTSDRELYSTYCKLLDLDLKLPPGEKWDRLRPVAEGALFPGYAREIRFAALSLDGQGLNNNGDCALLLRTGMIAHRAPVFEENCVLFMDRRNVRMSEADRLPPGFRANWEERAKLCAAKLGWRLTRQSLPADFPGLLLRQGQTSQEDEFVEVHIWGAFSIRAVEKVIVSRELRPLKSRLQALEERLRHLNVSLEVM